jgi:uncharacterized repeat protein (TIGR03803 family)
MWQEDNVKFKSPSTGTALMLTTVMLFAAAATTLATAQTYTVLYNFGTNSSDPMNPQSGVIVQGRYGRLNSTTAIGGTGWGTVFNISTAGALNVLYDFPGTDGIFPYSGVTLATDGDLYGTTEAANPASAGTIFKIPASVGTPTLLYTFTGGSDGGGPEVPPIQATDANFYGTTTLGGHQGPKCVGTQGCGTVYKLTPSGEFTTLHQFEYSDGENPIGPLVQGTDGSFYGMTFNGGSSRYGVVFKMAPGGKVTVLHSFTNGADGAGPSGGLIQASDGNFYGTTTTGGGADGRGSGTIFKITPDGALTTLHTFNGTSDGSVPGGGLVQATDSNFYGTAGSGGTLGYGTIYSLTLAGSFSVLYNFDNTSGASPQGALVQHTNGLLYGAAAVGGTGGSCILTPPTGCGVFFSLDVGLGPFVSLLPYSGKAGRTIEFLGQGFTGTTSVSFNGTPATFTVGADTFLTAVVPSGATTGLVTVTTPGGTLTSNKQFQVTP